MDTRRLKRFAIRARKEIFALGEAPQGDGAALFSADVPNADHEAALVNLFTEFVFERLGENPHEIKDGTGENETVKNRAVEKRDKTDFSAEFPQRRCPKTESPFDDPRVRAEVKRRLGVLADAVTEPEDWERPEVGGWLHQFWVAGRKRRNRQGVVNADDLAASTQLFTPDWIADYLVQNSLGARLLEIWPDSSFLRRLPYRTRPRAEETRSESEEDHRGREAGGNSISSPLLPEKAAALVKKVRAVTFLDPSCGTGHLLLAAFDLFNEVYRRLGVEEKKISKIILTHNLRGLDLDETAVNLARRILTLKAKISGGRESRPTGTPKIFSFPQLNSEEIGDLTERLAGRFPSMAPFAERFLRFYQEKSFAGSLLTIPPAIQDDLKRLSALKTEAADRQRDPIYQKIGELLESGEILAGRFDCVVTNPPYLGRKGISPVMKRFAAEEGYLAVGNLYSLFIERCARFARKSGQVGIVAMQGWLFLPTFRDFRHVFLVEKTFTSLAHLGTGSFADIPGEVVTAAAFCFRNDRPAADHHPVFFRLVEGDAATKRDRLRAGANRFDRLRQSDFLLSSDAPLCYWLDDRFRVALDGKKTLGDAVDLRQGLATGDNRRFLRRWFEVKREAICFDARNRDDAAGSGKRWFPYNKGEGRQRWFGDGEFVVNWKDDGRELRANRPKSVIRNPGYYFRTGVTWSLVGSGAPGVRLLPPGFLFDVGGSSLFVKKRADGFPESDADEEEILLVVLGFLGSRTAAELLKGVNPTLNDQVGDLARLPFDLPCLLRQKKIITKTVAELVTLTRRIRNGRETSPNFNSPFGGLPGISSNAPDRSGQKEGSGLLSEIFTRRLEEARQTVRRIRRLEEKNNEIFAKLYGLEDVIPSSVEADEIRLSDFLSLHSKRSVRNQSSKIADEISLFRREMTSDFLSWFIGVLLGRFPLPENFTASRKFLAAQKRIQNNGFLFLTTDEEEGSSPAGTVRTTDSLVALLEEFLVSLDSKTNRDENLRFLADSLDFTVGNHVPGTGKIPPTDKTARVDHRSAARRRLTLYFLDDFFTDHLKRYHRLPIYWRLSDFLPKERRREKGGNRRLWRDVLLHYHQMTSERFRRLRDRLAEEIRQTADETERKKIDRLIRGLNRLVENGFSFDFDAGIEMNRRLFEIIMTGEERLPG